MRTAGIICEYNPFHAGHRYQIAETRRLLGQDTGVICLMSGNYVQRGEPAIYDKWIRAEMAVRGGADLVLELPMTVAVNAAGYFAAGAVDCLDKLGCVDYLCFGAEGQSTEALESTAACLRTDAFEVRLREELACGISYAKARHQALAALGGDERCLATPNNALGVDYIRRLMERRSSIVPVAIGRDSTLPSASDIRGLLTAGWPRGGQLAEGCPDSPIHTLVHGQRAVLAVVKTLPDVAFQQMPFGSEGLWSKMMKACRKEMSLEDIILACKSKRYTFSRLRRMLLCLYLGLSEEDMQRPVTYLRVLAFNDRGRELLRRAKEVSELPLVSGAIPEAPEAQAYFRMECRATDLYGLFVQPELTEPTGREKSHPPVYVKK